MKAKRLFALLLALVMVVGLFTISAAAYRDTCLPCYNLYNGNSTKYMYNSYGSWEKTSSTGTRVEGCGRRSGAHEHFVAKRRVGDMCRYHGLIGEYYYEWNYSYCP